MGAVTLRITGAQLLCQDEHPSLLAALEFHKVNVEYQCREGYCGSLSRQGRSSPAAVARWAILNSTFNWRLANIKKP